MPRCQYATLPRMPVIWLLNSVTRVADHRMGRNRLLLLMLAAVLANALPLEDLVGQASQHQQLVVISGRNLVPVRTLDGDVAWVEIRFLNETHGRNFKHLQANSSAIAEKLSIILPVLALLVSFLVWMFCMVICLHRSQQRHVYY
ncbi:uncharacterized protein LOC142776810 [Rhipicephalus microplus]|uniref:uncharacterized protein LOC142776810 n=1 Tax=Rhipicephalus microplus TaxID=6941 RepID=UPI003F6BA41A